MTNIGMRRTPLDLAWESAISDSFDEFRHVMSKAMLFPRKQGLRRFSLNTALASAGHEGLIAEFGVYRGAGINQFAQILKAHELDVVGFDSFEGLEENWTGHHNGRETGGFDLGGELPEVPRNAQLIKGMIQDTLPSFLDQNQDHKFTFVHMDFDTYTPTAFTLKKIKNRLQKGTVILFDELYGYPGWRDHEWRALKQHIDDDRYKFIGFSTESVAIQVI